MGEQNSFEPLLVHQFDEPIDLAAFSQACLVAKKISKKKQPRRESA